MLQLCTVVGARPQFIKAAALSHAIQVFNSENPQQQINETIIHTGQHYDPKMSDIFFDQMKIPRPAFNLNVNGGTHGKMTGVMLEKLEAIFLEQKPDCVIVFGDTNSTLAAALAASKLHIPIAHIEAGLRSFNMQMPEEVNRILTDRISTYLFCPSQTAVENLRSEGIPDILTAQRIPCFVSLVGDIMLDAVQLFRDSSPSIANSDLIDPKKKNIFVTLHRQENVDCKDNLLSIFSALEELSDESNIIFPIHPRTRNRMLEFGVESKIKLIDPMGYIDLLQIVGNCDLVVTDSGGLQKEAFFLSKPCLVLREQTEWVELTQLGVAKLVGTNKSKILAGFHDLCGMMEFPKENPFGDGNSAMKIVVQLANGLLEYET